MTGLGKTLTTLVALDELKCSPVLIICPKFALGVWQNELRQWLEEESVVYTGKPKEREEAWQKFIIGKQANGRNYKFLISNYEMLSEIGLRSGLPVKTLRTAINNPGTHRWAGIVWDEAHTGGLFNPKTTAYKMSYKFAKSIPCRFVLTGTPYRQGCVDLFGTLSLVDPDRFKSYWSFIHRYCTITETMFGKEIERNPRDLGQFREMLQNYVVRRFKDDVLTELPGKRRQPLIVEMNKKQQKLYDELSEELLAFVPDSGELLITPNVMSLMMRQRQILACPQELGLKDRGAGIDAIIAHSHLSLDEDKSVAVFTPFRKAIPYLIDAFTAEYPDVHLYLIQGKMTADEFRSSWEGFQNDKYKRKVLLCVIKSGASFTATSCHTGYFLGYEWDFNLNEQAEDRLYRIGQNSFVNIYYILHKHTVDEEVLAKLNSKKASSNLVMGSEEQYLKALHKTEKSK